MTEKQLITKLQILKNVKPRENWVVFTKSQIFEQQPMVAINRFGFREFFAGLFSLNIQRKLAYSFGALLFIFAGVFGFAQYTLPGDMLFEVKKITEQSQSALIGESNLKNNVETFKKRSHDLAQIVKENKEGNKASAIQEVKDATKNLTVAIQADASLIKEVAMEIKANQTLLTILAEEDLKETSQTLYKAIDVELILDLDKAILNEEQSALLVEIKGLFDVEKYSEALEKILLINLGQDENNKESSEEVTDEKIEEETPKEATSEVDISE